MPPSSQKEVARLYIIVKFAFLCVFAEFQEAYARCFFIEHRELLRFLLYHSSLGGDYDESDLPSLGANGIDGDDESVRGCYHIVISM